MDEKNSRELLRISGIVNDSIVDGPGFRLTVFTQGCPHRCKGCHNPQTHDITGGREISVSEIFEKFQKNSLLCGITLSGGEPLIWAEPLAVLAETVRRAGKTVWLYSGYTFEEIAENKENNPGWAELLRNTDILVDGPYIEAQRSLMLKFRGSKNQRIIDVQKSLEAGSVREMR